MLPAHINSRYLAYLFLILTVMSWGFATVVIKATVEYVPPMTFLMLRFWLTAIVLVPAAIYILKHYKINLIRFRHIFTASTIGHVIALALIFIGIEKTTAIEASLITSFSPLLVTALGFFILKETVTKRELEGILIAFIGTFIIIFAPLIGTDFSIFEAAENARTTFIGNLIFLCGIAFDGLYAVYTKKNLSHDKVVTPVIQIVFSFLFAALIFTPIGLFEQNQIYRQHIYGNARECNIDDIDRSNYSSELTCDNKGCYNPQSVNTYMCIIESAAPTSAAYISNNLFNYLKPNTLYGILYMSFISGLLAYIFFQMGIKRIDVGDASIFYYLQPLFGVPAAIIFLKEEIHPLFIVGALLVAYGVYKAESDRKKWIDSVKASPKVGL